MLPWLSSSVRGLCIEFPLKGCNSEDSSIRMVRQTGRYGNGNAKYYCCFGNEPRAEPSFYLNFNVCDFKVWQH